MREDTVITLEDGKKYLLLLESETTKESYFLAVVLDNDENPTNNYAVLEEVTKNDKTFVKKVKNVVILNQLLNDFKAQRDELHEEKAA